MNWRRVGNREWRSDCGDYHIQALRTTAGYGYAAVYNPDDRRHIGLGIYQSQDSISNAGAAKHACEQHRAKQTRVA